MLNQTFALLGKNWNSNQLRKKSQTRERMTLKKEKSTKGSNCHTRHCYDCNKMLSPWFKKTKRSYNKSLGLNWDSILKDWKGEGERENALKK